MTRREGLQRAGALYPSSCVKQANGWAKTAQIAVTVAHTRSPGAKKNQSARFFNRICTRFAQVFHRHRQSRGTRFQLRFGRKVKPQVFGDLPNLIVEAADGSHVLLRQSHEIPVLRSRDTGRRILQPALIAFRLSAASICHSAAIR